MIDHMRIDIGQRPVEDKVVPVGMLVVLLIARREGVALSESHGRDFGSAAEEPDLRIASEIACQFDAVHLHGSPLPC